MPALQHLLFGQLGGWLIAIVLFRLASISPDLSAPASPAMLALWLTQAVAAAGLSWWRLRAGWWLVIQALFTPLAVVVHQLALPPAGYLAGLAVLLLVYGGTFRTRVPLFLSNAQVVAALAELLRRRPADSLLDIGCGVGSVLVPLARHFPLMRVTGCECALAPYAVARWRTRQYANCSVLRSDFWRLSWAEHDCVYAFLSPVPMAEVWEKACRELPTGGRLISCCFPVPGIRASQTCQLDDPRRSILYVYEVDHHRPPLAARHQAEQTTLLIGP